MHRLKQGVPPERAIQAVSLIALAALAWPVPGMVLFANPRDAVVLGRYTLAYFLLMVVYLAAALCVAAFTGWALLRLTPDRLSRLRRAAEPHPALFLIAAGGAALALAAVRALNLAGAIAFPASLVQPMTIIPGVLIAAVLALAILFVDEPLARRLDSALAWTGRLRLTGDRLALAAALLIAALYLGYLAANAAFWTSPVSVDGSMHIYIGQTVLAGGAPYRAFVTPYGPTRFLISLIWNVGARLLHVPVADFGRALNLLAAFALLAGVYGIGQRLTGRSLGGLLAVIVLLGFEQVEDVLIGGPIFKPVEVLLMVAALWLAQRSRWFWAGAAVALATMAYTPMALVAFMLVVAALLQNEQPRVRAGVNVMLGGLAVVGPVVVLLALVGSLGAVYQELVHPLLGFFAGILSSGAGQGGASFKSGWLAWMGRFPAIIGWQYAGDWELLALVLLGLVTTLVRRGRAAIQSPEVSALLLTAVPLALAMLLDEGGSSDFFVRSVMLAPFGAAAIIDIMEVVFRRDSTPHLRRGMAASICALLLVLGLADGLRYGNYIYSLVNIPLKQQQRMADDLHAALRPGDRVFTTTHMWYLALTGDPNAIPIRRFGARLKSIEGEGWTPDRVLADLEANPPVVIMWLGQTTDAIQGWINDNYVWMGRLDFDGQNVVQDIYVLKGRPDILDVVSRWPLTQ